MNEYEKACKEFLKNCTCASPGKPQECEECTQAFVDKIRDLAEKDEFEELDQHAIHGLK